MAIQVKRCHGDTIREFIELKTITIVAPILIMGALLQSCDMEPSSICVSNSKVVEIESIIYRGGWIKLENGMRFNVGQPHRAVTIGSLYCYKHRKL